MHELRRMRVLTVSGRVRWDPYVELLGFWASAELHPSAECALLEPVVCLYIPQRRLVHGTMLEGREEGSETSWGGGGEAARAGTAAARGDAMVGVVV